MSDPPSSSFKPKSKDDKELLELLTKLYDMQETVGSKPKSTLEDKRSRATNTATMGRGRAAAKKGTRFLELKSNILDRLRTTHSLLEEEKETNKNNAAGFSIVNAQNNPKEKIARQARMREEIREATDEWNELNSLYRNEAKKKRSRFSQEELDVQQTLVQRLYAELEKVKEVQARNTVRNGARDDREDVAIGLNMQALNVMDFNSSAVQDVDGPVGWTANGNANGNAEGSKGGVELTQQQHLQLQEINSRDQDFDQQLDEIGEGIQDLADIAQMQNEEVRRQNVMLENVGNRIDDNLDHITNINAKMKETLNEVRSADKICVDIMCIVMMVGLGAVLYQMIKGT
eukprot:CAMPEP_0197247928 /NCGR_PEP_ID=MMETSP1429-20130617/32567_1 /TAXON_ID=49237 /ORGANISM="Chaetoceros  sp., Strain UNC1202" /LENGTH=344 /DNA_ID=CAMNT_0042708977 /DNA_START=56 /DNA_END=1090 /DNA_ORIENTATION=-